MGYGVTVGVLRENDSGEFSVPIVSPREGELLNINSLDGESVWISVGGGD